MWCERLKGETDRQGVDKLKQRQNVYDDRMRECVIGRVMLQVVKKTFDFNLFD